MKVLILAGGMGTRISEETDKNPKPMIEVGGMPILWHIMKIYSHFNYNEFIILLGYKGYLIKEYFANYFLHRSDVTIDMQSNKLDVHSNTAEPWKVTLLDTGLSTMTGGRIKQAEKYIDGSPFMLTYGDGVANVNIPELVEFHRGHGKLITMTCASPDGRFGAVSIKQNGLINDFIEKPKSENAHVNAGFFVCNPRVMDYIENTTDIFFEKAPLENLAKDNELYAYQHSGFWQPMDTLRDKNHLNGLWDKGDAPWKMWD